MLRSRVAQKLLSSSLNRNLSTFLSAETEKALSLAAKTQQISDCAAALRVVGQKLRTPQDLGKVIEDQRHQLAAKTVLESIQTLSISETCGVLHWLRSFSELSTLPSLFLGKTASQLQAKVTSYADSMHPTQLIQVFVNLSMIGLQSEKVENRLIKLTESKRFSATDEDLGKILQAISQKYGEIPPRYIPTLAILLKSSLPHRFHFRHVLKFLGQSLWKDYFNEIRYGEDLRNQLGSHTLKSIPEFREILIGQLLENLEADEDFCFASLDYIQAIEDWVSKDETVGCGLLCRLLRTIAVLQKRGLAINSAVFAFAIQREIDQNPKSGEAGLIAALAKGRDKVPTGLASTVIETRLKESADSLSLLDAARVGIRAGLGLNDQLLMRITQFTPQIQYLDLPDLLTSYLSLEEILACHSNSTLESAFSACKTAFQVRISQGDYNEIALELISEEKLSESLGLIFLTSLLDTAELAVSFRVMKFCVFYYDFFPMEMERFLYKIKDKISNSDLEILLLREEKRFRFDSLVRILSVFPEKLSADSVFSSAAHFRGDSSNETCAQYVQLLNSLPETDFPLPSFENALSNVLEIVRRSKEPFPKLLSDQILTFFKEIQQESLEKHTKKVRAALETAFQMGLSNYLSPDLSIRILSFLPTFPRADFSEFRLCFTLSGNRIPLIPLLRKVTKVHPFESVNNLARKAAVLSLSNEEKRTEIDTFLTAFKGQLSGLSVSSLIHIFNSLPLSSASNPHLRSDLITILADFLVKKTAVFTTNQLLWIIEKCSDLENYRETLIIKALKDITERYRHLSPEEKKRVFAVLKTGFFADNRLLSQILAEIEGNPSLYQRYGPDVINDIHEGNAHTFPFCADFSKRFYTAAEGSLELRKQTDLLKVLPCWLRQGLISASKLAEIMEKREFSIGTGRDLKRFLIETILGDSGTLGEAGDKERLINKFSLHPHFRHPGLTLPQAKGYEIMPKHLRCLVPIYNPAKNSGLWLHPKHLLTARGSQLHGDYQFYKEIVDGFLSKFAAIPVEKTDQKSVLDYIRDFA